MNSVTVKKSTSYANGKLYLSHEINTKTNTGEILIIKIRLSDDCNNGHNDFAITANLYKAGSTRLTDRNHLAGGCLHDEILKAKKSLKCFVDLHLSNEFGEPMYAIENGYYHLQGVQGVAQHGHTMTLERFAAYMRVDIDEAQKVAKTIKDKASFVKWVDTLRSGWLKEATEAKAKLLELIGNN